MAAEVMWVGSLVGGTVAALVAVIGALVEGLGDRGLEVWAEELPAEGGEREGIEGSSYYQLQVVLDR